jgi:chromosome segregation ATPase
MNDKILWDIIDGLRDELNIAQDGITDLNDVVKDLQAEAIEQIKDNKRLNDSYIELRKEYNDNYQDLRKKNKRLKELQAEDDGWIQQYRLGAKNYRKEIKELKAELDKEKEFAIETSIKNDRLMSQVGSNSSNSSSTHTHTISREIAEYMDHNDINKAYIFVVDADAVDEDGFIADSHAVSTIEDSNCVSIV